MRVLFLRRAQKLTQEQLAEAANVSAYTIGHIERGQRDDVRLSTIRAIARALGTTSAELVGDAPVPLPAVAADGTVRL